MPEPRWKQGMRELVALLDVITEDGQIDGVEIGLLYSWRDRWKTSLRAKKLAPFMDWLNAALADGQFDSGEVDEAIQWAHRLAERSPDDEDPQVRETFESRHPDIPFGKWRHDPATQKQYDFLIRLGADRRLIMGLTKGQASDLIDELIDQQDMAEQTAAAIRQAHTSPRRPSTRAAFSGRRRRRVSGDHLTIAVAVIVVALFLFWLLSMGR